MPSARRTVVINRPIDEVFAFFTTHENDRRWRTHVKEIDPQGSPAVGSRVHQVVAGPGGRGIPADIEVTAYEPPNHYAFKVVAGPARPTGDFRLTAARADATEVTLALDADLRGIKKLLLSGPVQKSMDSEVGGLDTAKQVLES